MTTTYGPIGIKTHSMLDVVFVFFGLASPWLMGFSRFQGATIYAVALSLVALGVNLITDYPGGAWKLLPYKWHRILEWISPPVFVLVPWLFFADAGRMPWVFTAIGIVVVLNATLTHPSPNPAG